MMRFYVKKYDGVLPIEYIYPCFLLNSITWDDYGRKTSFILSFLESSDVEREIGNLKILTVNKTDERGFTVLPIFFTNLDDAEFCSLGSDTSYYEIIKSYKNLFDTNELLTSLNDVVWLPGIQENFENLPGFKNSLLREREAKSALLTGARILRNIELDTIIKFVFSTKLKNAEGEHKVNFEFDKLIKFPKRIFALVGQNGTGKTQFLANLANALSFSQKDDELLDFETGYFDSELGPPFNKVISVSYSLFDNFKRPKPSKHYSYIYCGIRNENDEIDKKQLWLRHITSLKLINEKNRGSTWFKYLNLFFDIQNSAYKLSEWFYQITNIEELEINGNLNLSSGQSMLVYVLTELIAHMRENSLVLFDEPETHLHPNAIANLINVLYDLFNEFDSFAIISTHSPLVIQEIPSLNIAVFEREGNVPTTRPLEIESFGENLTTITKDIFETVEIKGHYKTFFERISKENTYKEILELFENRLSLNAKIFLRSQYPE